ncbi:MAG: hypothetical protein WBB36_10605, partial [Chitinophagales bacterium]
VFIELTKLDLVLTRCHIMIYDPKTNGSTWWMANSEAPVDPIGLYIKYHEHAPYLAYINAWQERNLIWQYILEGKDKKEWDDFLFRETELSQLPNFVKAGMIAPNRVYLSASFNNFGCLNLASLDPLSNEHSDILLRFGKVFDLTYTRFNDLQKAEAQAREAQIEATLEKVRSRSLAMHKADELGEVITVVVDKLKELDFSVSDGVALITYSEGSKDLLEWMANPGFPSALKFQVPYFEHPVLANLWKAKNEGKEFIMERYTTDENKSFLNHIFEHSDFKHTPQPIKDYCLAAETYATSIAFQKNTSIFINDYSGKSLSEQEIDILKRFSKVFEQAYVRFLDIQKSEAQARESLVELGLERVRARAMAMQKSEELAELVHTVFKELTKLDFALTRCIIKIIDEPTYSARWWMANAEADKTPSSFYTKFNELPYFVSVFNAWKERNSKWVYELNGTDKVSLDDYLFSETELRLLPPEVQEGMRAAENIILTASYSNFGSLHVSSLEPLTVNNVDILSRFGKVFDLTYTRFNDLQRAEAQAREAQIEAALEKVRGKAMAMHNSADLTDAAGQVFKELNNLGFNPIRCGFVLLSKDSRRAKLYPAASFDYKNIISFTGEFEFTGHPVYEMQYQSWQKKENYFPVLEGNILKSYYKILGKALSVPYKNFLTKNKKQFGTFLPFKEGFLFTWSDE